MPFLGTTGGGSVRQYGGLAKLGYLLRNSLRFRSSASAYLSRTGTTATNAKTATYSFWMKRGTLSSGTQWVFTGGTTISLIGFNAGADTLSVFGSDSLAEGNITTAVFRDPAAWYHVVIRINTTEGTAADRIKIYINGVQQAVSTNAGGLVLDSNWGFNTAGTLNIGRYTGASGYSDLYLAEVYFIDGGTPRDVSAFAKTDPVTGQWIPIKYAGTYGNNGFYLNFNDTSNTTAATLGKDSSGNGNNWTPNNFSITAGATYDPVTDVPTLGPAASNYCVLNPNHKSTTDVVLTEGNLYCASNYASGWQYAAATFGVRTGKWYWEAKAVVYAATDKTAIGVLPSTYGFIGNTNDGTLAGLYGITGHGAGVGSYTYSLNDTIMIAIDADNNKVYYGKNGTYFGTGNPSAGTGGTTQTLTAGVDYLPYVGGYNGSAWAVNFGQRAFTYTVPTGFKSLNTYNLP